MTFLNLLVEILFVSKQKVIKDLIREYQKYTWVDSLYVIDYSGKWVFKKSYFCPAKVGSFESLRCSIPNDTTSLLQLAYGDFMTLPPESERYNHGITAVPIGESEM